VADLPRSVVIDQVRNGVAVRMAVLFDLLGSGRDLARQPDPEGAR
jgi:aspartate carbamoyltransferase catalytic subunit